jgi:hypothetical protein
VKAMADSRRVRGAPIGRVKNWNRKPNVEPT